MMLDYSSLLAGIRFEFLYPLLERASVKTALPAHWSRWTEVERLEAASEASEDVFEHWQALGELWLAKGNFIRARSAFDRALRISPKDIPTLLRRAAATATFDPQASQQDLAEAEKLQADQSSGYPVPADLNARWTGDAGGTAEQTIYVDITDMMDYLRVNTMFSGIQRVVANTLRQAKSDKLVDAHRVIPIIQIYDERTIYCANFDLVLALVDAVEGGSPNRARLNRLLNAVLTSLRIMSPQRGDAILIAGAFWTVPSYDLLKEMRERGVSICLFVHDLIQIDNPEFVHDSAKETFIQSFVDIMEVTSSVTTNSAFVASEVRRFLSHELSLDKPVLPVPLATEMSLHEPDPSQDSALASEYGAAGYVLCVCTIEVRKNHSYLYHIWEELIRRKFPDLPTLVFVGKWGWGVDDFRDVLERGNYLDDKIRVLTGVSDEELAALYRNCRFSIYPSFVEGWGLPIGESLMLGRPCAASGVSSMPEVGGTLVRYFDPLDLSTGLALVEEILGDPDGLAAWTEQVRREFKPRTWADFCGKLLGATRALSSGVPPAAFSRLVPGAVAVIGHRAVLAEAGSGRSLRTARMARHRGWDDIEDGGVWSIARIASLRFIAIECAPGDAIEVVVNVRCERGQVAAECRLRGDGDWTQWKILGSELSRHRCPATVGKDGLVEITLAMRGEPIRHGNKVHYVYLSHVGFRRSGSAADTLSLEEGFLFG